MSVLSPCLNTESDCLWKSHFCEAHGSIFPSLHHIPQLYLKPRAECLEISTSQSGSKALSVIRWHFFFPYVFSRFVSCPELLSGPACSSSFISKRCSSAKNRAVHWEEWRTERKGEDGFTETAVYYTTILLCFFIFCLGDNWNSQRSFPTLHQFWRRLTENEDSDFF